jgi:hypothetical protein
VGCARRLRAKRGRHYALASKIRLRVNVLGRGLKTGAGERHADGRRQRGASLDGSVTVGRVGPAFIRSGQSNCRLANCDSDQGLAYYGLTESLGNVRCAFSN